MELEDAIRKIQKLRNMTVDRGCTPAEAAHAAAKVRELLDTYQLSIFDVETKRVSESVWEEIYDASRQRLASHVVRFASFIAHGFDCRLLIISRRESGKRLPQMMFIGLVSDAKVAKYLFEVLHRELWAQADREARDRNYRGAGLRRFKSSFMVGAGREIYDRLKPASQPATGAKYALVEVKSQLLSDYIRKSYGDNLKSHQDNSSISFDGLAAGKAAGRRVEIRRGLEGGSATTLLR